MKLVHGQVSPLEGLPTFLRNLLEGCPTAGVNRWLFNCARHLHAHLDEAEIFKLLKEKSLVCGRVVRDREIKRQIECSRSASWRPHNPEAFTRTYPEAAAPPCANLPPLAPPPSPPWPKPDSIRIRELVAGGSSLHDLWECSPARFDDGESHAEQIVDTLFPGNALLCCGQSNDRFATRRREVWRRHLERLALIVPTPMLAATGRTQEGKASEHTLDATARRIYLVVEFDFSEFARDGVTETEWTSLAREWRAAGLSVADACAALHMHLAERLPLVAAVHSGGKSLHGWFAAFTHTEDRLRAFMNYAVSIGADRATWTRSQFVRLPDGARENGKRQVCYYLDPKEAVKNE